MTRMEEGEGISGPWRATRLWNEIIRNFRTGMPLKKHKKNLRTYDNCFSSTEAIEWLHKNLQKNPNFGTDVSKEQTIQLLKKLYRAGIIENVKENVDEEEFKVAGEFYRFSNKSPVRNLRTPGKENRKPLTDTGNTPRRELTKSKVEPVMKPERDRSANRKAKEEMKKQLNLSYFQALPSNSLIMLDNDDTWRKVYMEQLSRVLSTKHTERLDYSGQLDMDHVMHNMTRVSLKGIVQIDDKSEDLPHWVLSAMKCLANWPRQLRTLSGRDSCLPTYVGFENDVFNVVKDYFVGLQYPLTTCHLYEFLIDGYQKAEGKLPPPTAPKPSIKTNPGCCLSQGPPIRPATFGFTETKPESSHKTPICQQQEVYQSVAQVQQDCDQGYFYKMTDSVDEFSTLTNQERVAKIRQTFQVLPPLATSSLQNSNNTSSSLSGHSTFDTISPSLSPDPASTSNLKKLLPPNTCFETAFVDTSPITRIVPQKEHEVLHIKRSWSGRSLLHIPTSDWATRSAATQTDDENVETNRTEKRVPRWKRTSRFRKSIAVMETERSLKRESNFAQDLEGGITNPAFCDPVEQNISMCPYGRDTKPMEYFPLENKVSPPNRKVKGFSSVGNLLEKEKEFEEEFMLKYRQVSGDLRGSCDLLQTARLQYQAGLGTDDNRHLIQSKTVRKEKRKRGRRHHRAHSEDSYGGGYATDSEILYDSVSRNDLDKVNERYWRQNRSLDTSPITRKENHHLAPLAMDETVDLSPVPFARNNKYNNSYRLATNQPATPVGKSMLPRTSTKLELQQPHAIRGNSEDAYSKVNKYSSSMSSLKELDVVRAEPYSNGQCHGYNKIVPYKTETGAYSHVTGEQPGYESSDARHIYGYVGHRSANLKRNTESRLSRCSQATVDSGRYSDVSRASTSHRSMTIGPRSTSGSQRTTSSGLYVLPPGHGVESVVLPPGQGVESVVLSPGYKIHRSQHNTRTLPPRVLSERLKQLSQNPAKIEQNAINILKLLTLLIPPSNRRKLQLLIKFIRKVSLNHELTLSKEIGNREFSINTFTSVILRPSDPSAAVPAIDRKIVDLFLNRYEEIWSPPETLRLEVENRVYRSLVNKRLEAGEDPYPITYCKQVTKQEYEMEKLTGAESGLMDLLEAIIEDIKMSDKEKAKKMKKFKESYPHLWRRRFPTVESEPALMTSTATKINKFSSLSRIKNRMGV